MSGFQEQYASLQGLVEQAISDSLKLPDTDWPDTGMPRRLVEAMRYSMLNGGKRLRPVLLLAAYQSMHQNIEPALPFAVALECIHTYSLIHDDLPAMDDDDLRRGKPTSHKVFGEALAILAGDALLTFAFELMSSVNQPGALAALHVVAKRCGAGGMIAGQTADIGLAGQTPTQDSVYYIHRHKTADLVTAPMLAGLHLAGADEGKLRQAEAYGLSLGLAFQMTDDLLDIEGDARVTGKAGHRDEQLGKQTWPLAVGVEQARRDVAQAIEAAVSAAEAFGDNAAFFEALALSIPNRVK